jgi:hypothetical protein
MLTTRSALVLLASRLGRRGRGLVGKESSSALVVRAIIITHHSTADYHITTISSRSRARSLGTLSAQEDPIKTAVVDDPIDHTPTLDGYAFIQQEPPMEATAITTTATTENQQLQPQPQEQQQQQQQTNVPNSNHMDPTIIISIEQHHIDNLTRVARKSPQAAQDILFQLSQQAMHQSRNHQKDPSSSSLSSSSSSSSSVSYSNSYWPSQALYNIVLRAWANQGKASIRPAETLFHQMCQDYLQNINVHCMPDADSFLILMQLYAKSSRRANTSAWKQVQELWNMQQELYETTGSEALAPTLATMMCVLNCTLQAPNNNNTNEGVELAHAMLLKWYQDATNTTTTKTLQRLPKPPIAAFNTCMVAWSKSGGNSHAAEKIEELFQVIRQDEDLQPNANSFSARINGWFRCNQAKGVLPETKAQAALDELLQMQEKEAEDTHRQMSPPPSPHGTHFLRVIHGWARKGHAIRAEQVLRRMVEECDPPRNNLSCTPTVYSYNILLLAYARSAMSNAGFHARRILNEMKERNIQSDACTMNTALNCWAIPKTEEAVDRALELFLLVEKGHFGDKCFDALTYGTLITIVGTSPLEKQEKITVIRELVHSMGRKNIQINNQVRRHVMQFLGKESITSWDTMQ